MKNGLGHVWVLVRKGRAGPLPEASVMNALYKMPCATEQQSLGTMGSSGGGLVASQGNIVNRHGTSDTP